MELNVMKCLLVKDSSVPVSNDVDGHTYTVADPNMVSDLMKELGVSDGADEYFYVLCVNTQNHIVGIHEISHGTLDASMVHPREVFKRALLNNAYGIICVHNHPSGNPAPSEADEITTKRLRDAGEMLGVPVLDHVIVTAEQRYYSFRSCDNIL